MEIENIIYQTTRGIYSVEDKLSIATIFIFCWRLSGKKFAELLYGNEIESLVSELKYEYSGFEVDFSIRLSDKNVKDAFLKTLEVVKEKYDLNGFYKALYEGDEFALVIDEITNFKFDKLQFKKLTNEVAKQLELNF